MTYELLSGTVVDSPHLLQLARRCRIGQPIPNLFFAGVKRVAMDHPGSELWRRYDSGGAGDRHDDGFSRAFVGFALEHRERILELVETRMVQTNEVGRCAYLAPGFLTVAAENPGRSLALVDVGASGGLNLLWDHYRYRYSDGTEFGPADAGVVIKCDARNRMPRLPTAFPEISFRVGIDLSPVILSDDEEYNWMQALVWPEHRDRAELLAAARDVWLRNPPEVWAGNALDLLPNAMRTLPAEAVPCVFHCHTLNQFSEAARRRFSEILGEESMDRTVYHVAAEGERMTVDRMENGAVTTILSGRQQVHGRWIEWDTDLRVSFGDR